MSELLDRAIAHIRALPLDVQDEAARILLLFAGDEKPPIQLTPEEEADLREADAEIARGELATNKKRGDPGEVSPLILRTTRWAGAQFDAILSHVASHSPSGAASLLARIEEVKGLLRLSPLSSSMRTIHDIRRIPAVPYP